MHPAGQVIEARLQHLETHLEQENPILLSTVQSFRQLDEVAFRLGLLEGDNSFAMQIPWWPLISVLGTFSAGKSTFINHYIDTSLQRSGNQAVDDRFTVICYSKEATAHALPGVALDSDPRFPFYQMSDEIEKVAQGEGDRIDAYLQLKTCPSEKLRGKILIDSPGFDADAQRTSTLRITDHIIDLSDLVLVFFDARHPEPGAMQDTLSHLIERTIHRNDTGKFLYILNQIDTTARENNPEDVIAAWQRALGERGLTAGRFYAIYNPDAAVPIEDEALRNRYEMKRDVDLKEIHSRMEEVEIERAYRIVGALEKTARDIEERSVPLVSAALERWKKRVLAGDALLMGGLLLALLIFSFNAGYWQGFKFAPPWLEQGFNAPLPWVIIALVLIVLVAIHYAVRKIAAGSLLKGLRRQLAGSGIKGNPISAFLRSTRPWRSIFSRHPAGWGGRSRKQLREVLQATDTYIQTLNDQFTNPSGSEKLLAAEPAPSAEEAHRVAEESV
ncbi:MAG: dynamin family protein [gamma proteobacterium symbiont of Ctena orbiculata]|nr:dynamin family protein [Candidatus Thiodiazotropha taylori]MBT3057403.1 dynamin family protein [Candidatus Thiodiazotropha sp. (ex Lucina pensylvanica)]MBV2093884.1 dynamin family protein [Candidatus Thiodiazotropha sp. (ex Codakia orbicularis)]PUB73528.1 MAG: dynamin family protein [gamma proteobacterium symbiont of Ctena orbiculata]MBT3063610.1 dynamin family protein [Candidatus Thiodiazotropha sp. (ex Lucina pensylvanica)]